MTPAEAYRPEVPHGVRSAGLLLGPGSRAVHMAWSPDGEALAASFADGQIWIWCEPNRGPVVRLRALAGAVEHLAWSPDGRLLAAGRKGPVLLWELGPGWESGSESAVQVRPSLSYGAGAVRGLAFSEAGELCAAIREPLGEGVESFSLRRYRLADGAELQRVESDDWDGAWIARSPNRTFLSFALPGDVTEVWDLRRLERIRRFAAPYQRAGAVALTPDRATIALGYEDGSVTFFASADGAPIQTLQIHEAPVFSLDFSPDGDLLASKSFDGTVRFRVRSDLRRGARLLEPALRYESEIAFHPHRPRLATYGDLNTTLRLWDLEPETLRDFGGDLMIQVMFFSANPTDVHLRLDEELREIQDHLAFAKLGDRFVLNVRTAAKTDDFIRFLTYEHPQIVHFSGHGSKTGSIISQDAAGKAQPIDADTLEMLFGLVKDDVRCVILNACHAEIQARAIARNIPYVVGMAASISDDAAIAYSKGFYQSYGNGESIEKAHDFGRTQIALSGHKEEKDIPVLIRREEILVQEKEPATLAAQA